MNKSSKLCFAIALAVALVPIQAQSQFQAQSQSVPSSNTLIKKSLAAQTLGTVVLPSAIDFQPPNSDIPIKSFALPAGSTTDQLPANFLGMMSKDFTPDKIGKDLTIADVPALGQVLIEQLIKAKPELKDLTVAGQKLGNIQDKTLAEVVPNLDSAKLADLKLGDIKFSGIDFSKAANPLTIADLGASKVSMDKIFTVPSATDPSAKLVKFDRVLTGERKGNKITSGSNRESPQKCGDSCDLVELQSATGDRAANGVQGVVGRKVPGGKGWLGQMITDAAGGEPGGWDIGYKDSEITYSFHQAKAKPGTAIGQLNFRACWGGFFPGCTGHIFPVPIATNSESNNPMIPFPLVLNVPIATASKATPAMPKPPPTAVASSVASTTPVASIAPAQSSGAKADVFGPNTLSSKSLANNGLSTDSLPD